MNKEDLLDKEQISAQELKELIENYHNVRALDVRSYMEYKRYHIKDALHIPIDELSIEKLVDILNINEDKKYIIATYCNAGGRGGRSFNLLKKQNTYNNIYIKNLTNGINQWIEEGFIIEENI